MRRSPNAILTLELLTTVAGQREEGMRIGAMLLAWFAMLYTLFAIANTVTMSFGMRSAEFGQLRMLGADRAQILRMVLWEGTAIAVTGLVLGGAATAISVGGLWQVLRSVGPDVPLRLPYGQLAAIGAGCVAVLLVVSSVATGLVLRSTGRP